MREGALLKLAPHVRGVARVEAEAILGQVAGVSAVVVATVDGFEIGSAVRSPMDVSRLAALASSIAAIGDVVSGEARLGLSRSVTVNTASGFAVVHAAPRTDLALVINVVSSEEGVLGLVNYHAARMARRLVEA